MYLKCSQRRRTKPTTSTNNISSSSIITTGTNNESVCAIPEESNAVNNLTFDTTPLNNILYPNNLGLQNNIEIESCENIVFKFLCN